MKTLLTIGMAVLLCGCGKEELPVIEGNTVANAKNGVMFYPTQIEKPTPSEILEMGRKGSVTVVDRVTDWNNIKSVSVGLTNGVVSVMCDECNALAYQSDFFNLICSKCGANWSTVRYVNEAIDLPLVKLLERRSEDLWPRTQLRP